jgi:hypothetical protein
MNVKFTKKYQNLFVTTQGDSQIFYNKRLKINVNSNAREYLLDIKFIESAEE